MRNLFDASAVDEVKTRLETLRLVSPRKWGKMTVAQMVTHCAVAMEWAVGDKSPSRTFLGRIIGGMVKRRVLGDDAPLRKGSPTAKEMIIRDERELETERARLRRLIDRFAAGGPDACTKQPHTFFGLMSPQEWSVLMYKHLDHHFRQFGA